MQLDIIAHPGTLRDSQEHAQQVEATGFGAIWWGPMQVVPLVARAPLRPCRPSDS